MTTDPRTSETRSSETRSSQTRSSETRSSEARSAPVDERAAAELAEKGYEIRVVDPADRDAMERYVQAEMRGFLGGRMERRSLDAHVKEFGENRRCTAVYDPESADPRMPIATSNSWIGPLALPGEREIDAWAISGVTVAQTHRRRGVQRRLMEAELRTAHRLAVPIAMLTVSESSIYGRYGFGVAALAAEHRIDTRALSWTGPTPGGRLDFIDVRVWRDAAPALFERVRLRDPGQMRPFALRWDQLAGLVTDDGDRSGTRQAVQYRDADGAVQGMALYTVEDDPAGFTHHRVKVINLTAVTDDAYAALWRLFVEMDLVGTVTYELGSVDEPLRWMVSDFRAVEVKPFDMQYLRVLDVRRVLEARMYESTGEASFEVVDGLGIATGSWTVRVDSGRASVAAGSGSGSGEVVDVAELGALAAGGVGSRNGPAAVSRLFASFRPPRLDFWY